MSWVADELASRMIAKLSTRQREVLQLVSRGLTNCEIGTTLRISVETVRTHVQAVIHRLGVSNRTEAAAMYLACEPVAERAPPRPVRPAIGVLPLQSFSPYSADLTAAAAMTRDLLALFSRWSWFPVINYVSTREVRARATTSQEIGALLGARFLLDSSLHAIANRMRITACICDTENGHCVWTDTYQVSRAAWPNMHDPICQDIVAAAYPQIIATIQASLPPDGSGEDIDPWLLTQQAFRLQGKREPGSNAAAQVGFRRAIVREPTLVLAHFGLGLALYDAGLHGWEDTGAALNQLEACADRCLTLAPHQAEGPYLRGCRRRLLDRQPDPISSPAHPLESTSGVAVAPSLFGQVLRRAHPLARPPLA